MTDTMMFVTGKAWDVPEPEKQTKKERAEKISTFIIEYQHIETTKKRKVLLQEKILREVYYFFPYFLKQHSLSKDLFDEALQNMVLQTYKAIDKFNPTLGVAFSVYLKKYLKAAISDAKQSNKLLRTPVSVRQKTLDRLLEKAEAAKDMDTALAAYSRYAELTPTFVQADEIHASNSDAFFENCKNTFDSKQSAENTMMSQELLDVLEYCLGKEADVLSEKEQVVVKHRYGVFNLEKMTLDEVAQIFHQYGWRASKEWIFQLQNRALKKIYRVYKYLDLA